MDMFPDYEVLPSGTSTPAWTPFAAHRLSRTSNTSRRSSRVEKPRSSHSSPKTIERRRTTSTVKKYATLEDHWEMMFGGKGSGVDDGPNATRPVSWHPSSTKYLGSSDSPEDHSPEQSFLNTPSEEFLPESTIPPPLSTSLYDTTMPYKSAPEEMDHTTAMANSLRPNVTVTSAPWTQMFPTPTAPTYPAVPYDPMPYALQQSFQQPFRNDNDLERDVDFLPIQHPPLDEMKASPTPENKSIKSGGKVLVGMGLYDPPDSGRPTFVGSTLLQGTGKGLKLEETFQPPSEQDDEDPVEDAGSDDEEEEELPNPPEPNPEPETHVPVNLSGQSFLFEDDDPYANDWWQQQLRYSGMVQDASMGLRWEA